MINSAINNSQDLQSVDEERDLGIVVVNWFKFHLNCKKTVHHTNFVPELFKKLFPVGKIFVRLYKVHVRPVLDF